MGEWHVTLPAMHPDLSQWRSSGQYVSFGKIKLFVRFQGNGSPVFCLHAFPTSSYDYSRIIPYLEKRFKLYFVDYPGFGFSDKPREFPYSLLKYADAVEAAIRHFGVGQIWLLSHDIGDSIALELLKRGNLQIEKIIMLNGSVYSIPFDDPVMWLSQRLWINKVTGPWISTLRLFRKPFFARMMNRIFAHPLSREETNIFWSLLQFNDGLKIYHRLMQYMPERWQHQFEWLEALRVSQTEISLIWGQADPVATPAVAEVVRKIRQDIRYIKLENVGHYPHWEQPDLVANFVQEIF
jgi:pimeloyl-ACP methyl ester carboxylesterase